MEKKFSLGFCAGYATCGLLAIFVIRQQETMLETVKKNNATQKQLINILLKGVSDAALVEAKTFLTDVKFQNIVRELDIDG